MERDPLQRPATRSRVWRLFKEEILPPQAWERAQRAAGFTPTGADWLGFIDRLLLIIGTILLVAGIVFFFAFNWADLPRLARFGIVQASVVIAAGLAFWFGLDSWGGRVSLAAASVLVGVTLAVVGQAYQTGADSWRLFFIWLLLISGWVLISRWNVQYFIWMLLLNTTISLYWYQVIGGESELLNYTLIAVNMLFIVVWDGLLHVSGWAFLRDRWHLYIFALPVVSYATFQMLDAIFDFEFAPYLTLSYQTVIYLIVIGSLAGFYVFFRRDLPMVTLAALSVLVVLVAWIGERLWYALYDRDSYVDDLVLYLLMMGMITIALTAGLAFGLQQLQRRWERLEADA